jgi:uncharacterized protein
MGRRLSGVLGWEMGGMEGMWERNGNWLIARDSGMLVMRLGGCLGWCGRNLVCSSFFTFLPFDFQESYADEIYVDLLILGLGKEMRPISPKTRQFINSLGIRVDVQDTRNAAAQFNLLATERGVSSIAAAMIPIGWKEGVGCV